MKKNVELLTTTIALFSLKKQAFIMDKEADLLIEESDALTILGVLDTDHDSQMIIVNRLREIKSNMEELKDRMEELKKENEKYDNLFGAKDSEISDIIKSMNICKN